jgi:DNA-binding PucR family transcriptional regulator
MALTVGDLLRSKTLDLKLVAGGKGLNRAIRWVHVSELEDPTPWLKGGELLLTTGIGVGRTPVRQRTYLERLAKAGLSGLGFGLGFSFQRTPKGLVDAAERLAFPIFEVPYELPFIAITEAVFTRLVAEQFDLLSRSLEAEHAMTRAVLEGGGVTGILGSLTRATGGWALVLDLHGTALAADPVSMSSIAPRVWSELRSPRGDGLRFGLSLVDRGQHIAVQPVQSQGRVEAYLAVGKKDALSPFDRIVFSHALSLLSLELDKARAVTETERRLKGDVLDQLLAGSARPADARHLLERVGFDLSRPVMAVAVAGGGEQERLVQALEEALVRLPGAFLLSPAEDHVLAVVQPEAPRFLPDLRAAVAGRAPGMVLAGAGSLVPFDQVKQGVREARYALQVCRTEGRELAEFADLGTYQLLLSLQDPEALRTFADSVLAPLDRYDDAQGGDLVPSLRAFLERNARWEAAAGELFVHRHTLRYRMRKVEELTGRDLSSARDRMEFFLALRARDLLASGDWAERDGAGGRRRPRPRRGSGTRGSSRAGSRPG